MERIGASADDPGDGIGGYCYSLGKPSTGSVRPASIAEVIRSVLMYLAEIVVDVTKVIARLPFLRQRLVLQAPRLLCWGVRRDLSAGVQSVESENETLVK